MYIYNHQNELAESVNFNSICATNATVIVVCYVSFLNLSRSIDETTSIIKIFCHSVCIEEPLQLMCWPLKKSMFLLLLHLPFVTLGNDK